MSHSTYDDEDEDDDDEVDDREDPDPSDQDASDDEDEDTLPCPFCGKPVYEGADVCPYCREESDRFIIEHVIPLSRGGENTIYNVIPACWSCNERKGRKMPWGWLPAHRLDAFVDDVLDALDRYEKRKARSD